MASGLSIGEFKESGKYWRAELLVSKIENKEKFKVRDQEKYIQIDYWAVKAKESFNKKPIAFDDVPKAKIFVIIDGKENSDNPNLISLAELEKTAEFGSSGGSGGGATQTASAESMGCYFIAYLFNNKKNISKFEKVTEKNTTKYLNELDDFFKLTTNADLVWAYDKKTRWNFTKLLNKAPLDIKWMNTYINTANIVRTQASKFSGNKVYLHRGSLFMDAIYAKKSNCQKHDKALRKNTAPGSPGSAAEPTDSFRHDKWNPSDIWMTTQGPKDDPFPWTDPANLKPEHICDWLSLKQSVAQAAQGIELPHTLGISLKKASGDAKKSEWNPSKLVNGVWVSDRLHNKQRDIKYDGFVFGQAGDFFNSADMYLHFSGGKTCQYRATGGGAKSWQGEIKGIEASAGKAGGTPTNYYSEHFLGKAVGSYPRQNSLGFSGTWQEMKKPIKGKKDLIDNMHNLYSEYNNLQKTKKKTSVKISTGTTNNPYSKLSDDWEFTTKSGNYTYTSKLDVVSRADFEILADNYVYRGRDASAQFYFGKYMGLQLIYNLLGPGSTPQKRHDFSLNLVRYAMSNLEDVSTYYWKVS